MRTRRLERDLAGGDLPPHLPVATVRQPGILERRRLVVLEEKVSDPGKAVADHQSERYEPQMQRQQPEQDGERAQARADEVQPAAGPVRVLRQVVRIELVEVVVSRG